MEYLWEMICGVISFVTSKIVSFSALGEFLTLPCVFNAYCVYKHLCSTGADQQNTATSNEKMQFLLALLSSVYARSACKSRL